MKRLLTLMACLWLFTNSLHAQKDAPVAGHAASLIDLLKKDYSGIDPMSRAEEISRDRTTVISIFKSYLTEEHRKSLKDDAYRIAAKALDTELKNYIKVKKELEVLSASTGNDKTAAAIAKAVGTVDDARKKYLDEKVKVDDEELKAIKAGYVTAKNEFLVQMITHFETKYGELKENEIDKYSAVNTAASIQKGIPFIGGSISFEEVIVGLKRFMANRIKEELTAYFLEQVKIWLEHPRDADPLAEFKVLLPQTTQFLRNFSADNVADFPNKILQYIEDDLNHIIDNAGNLRHTPRMRSLLEDHPDIDFAFEALELIPSMSKIKYVTDYFTFLENSRNISRWKKDPHPLRSNIANAIHLTSLLSRSLIVIDNGEPRFAGVDFLGTYGAESHFFMLYAGFLNQQNIKYYEIGFQGRQQTFKLSDALGTLVKMTEQAEKFGDMKELFRLLLIKTSKDAEKIFLTATEIRKANKAGIRIGADTVYTFIEGVLRFSEDLTKGADDLIEELKGFIKHPETETFQLAASTAPYFTVARTTNEVIYDIRSRRFATGLIKVAGITAQLVKNNKVASFASIVAGLTPEQYGKSAEEWGLLLSALLKEESNKHLKVNEKLKTALEYVAKELGRIELFYRVEYDNTSLLSNIQEFKSFCVAVFQDGQLKSDKLASIQSLVKNEDFRDLVISYYSNVVLNKAYKKLGEEMAEIKMKNANNSEFRVFSDEDVKLIVDQIKAYTSSAYNYYFLKSGVTKEEQLAKARQLVLTTLARYTALLPERMDIAMPTNLVSLLHFVHNMAVAEDADDVEKAISAFALPAGSYAVKRTSKSNFSINSYPGILVGYETSFKEGKELKAFSIGVTAPVGLSFAFGKNTWSYGVFVPIIDIGAVTRLRLDDNSETQALPDFNFKNILSPGIYFSLGIPKSPFSFNIGAQYGPELKEVKKEGAKMYESMRFGVGAVLDIPLLNLHTRRHN